MNMNVENHTISFEIFDPLHLSHWEGCTRNLLFLGDYKHHNRGA